MSPTLRRRDAGHAIGLSTLPPLLARLYAARGVTTAEEAEPRLAHLLDPASSWITGQVIGVDGGMSRVRGM